MPGPVITVTLQIYQTEIHLEELTSGTFADQIKPSAREVGRWERKCVSSEGNLFSNSTIVVNSMRFNGDN
jgi:hypothetical protein